LFHQLLLLLLYVAEVSSSLNHHEKRTIPESNFITLQGILTHMLGNFPFRATIPLIFRVMDQRHHKRLQDHTHLQRDCMTVLPSAMQNVHPHVGACVHKPKFEWWGICPLSGCYRHNLDGPEVGHGARWAWKITITSLRIGPCADDWGQKGHVNIDIGS
jgi:hypothetical protein